MIKLTVLLKRNPALSAEEFQQHWRTTHADLIRNTPGVASRVIRYVQRSPLEAPGLWTGMGGFDGVAEQWYASMDDFVAMISDPGYLEHVFPDEERLLDRASLVALITEETRVLVDGEAD